MHQKIGRSKFGIFSLLYLLSMSQANAGTVVCGGQIKQVNFHSLNGFMLQLDSMNLPVFFCDPSSTWSVAGTTYTTTAEQCRALVSTFLAAKLAGKSLAVVYFDGDATPASCSTWSPWQRANIRYFGWAD